MHVAEASDRALYRIESGQTILRVSPRNPEAPATVSASTNRRHPMSRESFRSRPRQLSNMSFNRPCYRHAPGVWMAYCPDCTAWYLAVQITRRNVPAGPCVTDGRSPNLTAMSEKTHTQAPQADRRTRYRTAPAQTLLA